MNFVCEPFRENDGSICNIPIVLVSKNIENSAMEAGAADFLAKPFEIDDLLEKVKKHLAA